MAGTLVCWHRVTSFSVDSEPHVPCRKCTTQKNICIHSKQVCANKAARQLFCSSLLFCFWKLIRFLKISVQEKFFECLETRNSKLDSRSSKIETRFSILENFEDRESSFKSRLSPLSGTVNHSSTNDPNQCDLNYCRAIISTTENDEEYWWKWNSSIKFL